MDPKTKARRIALRNRCRHLQGHGPELPADHLEKLSQWCRAAEAQWDHYGTGSLIEDFETKVAHRLGMPAARFVPSGKIAQNVAMKIWCDRAHSRHFGMHPSSHLELHEERAYAALFDLRATLIGPFERPMLVEHVRACAEPMAALLTELPIREAGGQLPSWDELEELKAYAHDRGMRLHLDGARLWECAASYERSYEEICRGFDSVYVSFYKGIGALSGAMLLGPEDFIEEAKVWQKRCGGTLFTLLPNVASAAMLFDERLARMPRYYEQALRIAEALTERCPQLQLLPAKPQTNMMHVLLPLEPEEAYRRRDHVAEETGLWLFSGVEAADVPGYARYEWYVGDAACALEANEVCGAFERLLDPGSSALRVPPQL